MTNALKLAALSFAMACVMAAPAFAGGGSSKSSNPILTVKNSTGANLYVMVVEEGEESNFQSDVIGIIEGSVVNGVPTETFATAFNTLGGQVIQGSITNGVINAGSRVYNNLGDGEYSILYANTAAVDAVILDTNAAANIEALFSTRSVDLDDDVTVNLQ